MSYYLSLYRISHQIDKKLVKNMSHRFPNNINDNKDHKSLSMPESIQRLNVTDN